MGFWVRRRPLLSIYRKISGCLSSLSLVNQPVFPDCTCAWKGEGGKGKKKGLAKLDRFSWNKLADNNYIWQAFPIHL